MTPIRDDLTLLRDRRFAALFGARTLSMLGLAFAPVALAFGVLALPGADAGTLPGVVAADAIPHVLGLLSRDVRTLRAPDRVTPVVEGEYSSPVDPVG